MVRRGPMPPRAVPGATKRSGEFPGGRTCGASGREVTWLGPTRPRNPGQSRAEALDRGLGGRFNPAARSSTRPWTSLWSRRKPCRTWRVSDRAAHCRTTAVTYCRATAPDRRFFEL